MSARPGLRRIGCHGTGRERSSPGATRRRRASRPHAHYILRRGAGRQRPRRGHRSPVWSASRIGHAGRSAVPSRLARRGTALSRRRAPHPLPQCFARGAWVSARSLAPSPFRPQLSKARAAIRFIPDVGYLKATARSAIRQASSFSPAAKSAANKSS